MNITKLIEIIEEKSILFYKVYNASNSLDYYNEMINEKQREIKKMLKDPMAYAGLLDEIKLHDLYDEMLDDAYGEVSLAGLDYPTSTLLRRGDEIAYNLGFNDYIYYLSEEEDSHQLLIDNIEKIKEASEVLKDLREELEEDTLKGSSIEEMYKSIEEMYKRMEEIDHIINNLFYNEDLNYMILLNDIDLDPLFEYDNPFDYEEVSKIINKKLKEIA